MLQDTPSAVVAINFKLLIKKLMAAMSPHLISQSLSKIHAKLKINKWSPVLNWNDNISNTYISIK